MARKHFAAGVVVGAVAALAVSVAFPALLPARAPDSPPRVSRTVEVVREPAERVSLVVPPSPPASVAPTRGEAEGRAEPGAAGTEPGGGSPRKDARAQEIAAVATVRNLCSAQAQFQASARADEDEDGIGEYGSLAELSGALGVRDGRPLNPPVLSSAFRVVKRGRVERNGYCYRIYLPGPAGQPLGERPDGGIGPRETDVNLAETAWCCYAWPVEGDGPTFFMNQAGDILVCPKGGYSGDREPAAEAAFRRDTPSVTGKTALNDVGCDGHDWKKAG
jgi:hypothetical protein